MMNNTLRGLHNVSHHESRIKWLTYYSFKIFLGSYSNLVAYVQPPPPLKKTEGEPKGVAVQAN